MQKSLPLGPNGSYVLLLTCPRWTRECTMSETYYSGVLSVWFGLKLAKFKMKFNSLQVNKVQNETRKLMFVSVAQTEVMYFYLLAQGEHWTHECTMSETYYFGALSVWFGLKLAKFKMKVNSLQVNKVQNETRKLMFVSVVLILIDPKSNYLCAWHSCLRSLYLNSKTFCLNVL